MKKRKLHIRFLWLLVPFLAASCLYLFLYQYNNKYTRTHDPAGQWSSDSVRERASDQPCSVLKSGWAPLSRRRAARLPRIFQMGSLTATSSIHRSDNAATFIPTVFQTVPMDTALMCSGFLCLQSKAIRWNCRRSSVHAGYMWMISWC